MNYPRQAGGMLLPESTNDEVSSSISSFDGDDNTSVVIFHSIRTTLKGPPSTEQQSHANHHHNNPASAFHDLRAIAAAAASSAMITQQQQHHHRRRRSSTSSHRTTASSTTTTTTSQQQQQQRRQQQRQQQQEEEQQQLLLLLQQQQQQQQSQQRSSQSLASAPSSLTENMVAVDSSRKGKDDVNDMISNSIQKSLSSPPSSSSNNIHIKSQTGGNVNNHSRHEDDNIVSSQPTSSTPNSAISTSVKAIATTTTTTTALKIPTQPQRRARSFLLPMNRYQKLRSNKNDSNNDNTERDDDYQDGSRREPCHPDHHDGDGNQNPESHSTHQQDHQANHDDNATRHHDDDALSPSSSSSLSPSSELKNVVPTKTKPSTTTTGSTHSRIPNLKKAFHIGSSNISGSKKSTVLPRPVTITTTTTKTPKPSLLSSSSSSSTPLPTATKTIPTTPTPTKTTTTTVTTPTTTTIPKPTSSSSSSSSSSLLRSSLSSSIPSLSSWAVQRQQKSKQPPSSSSPRMMVGASSTTKSSFRMKNPSPPQQQPGLLPPQPKSRTSPTTSSPVYGKQQETIEVTSSIPPPSRSSPKSPSSPPSSPQHQQYPRKDIYFFPTKEERGDDEEHSNDHAVRNDVMNHPDDMLMRKITTHHDEENDDDILILDTTTLPNRPDIPTYHPSHDDHQGQASITANHKVDITDAPKDELCHNEQDVDDDTIMMDHESENNHDVSDEELTTKKIEEEVGGDGKYIDYSCSTSLERLIRDVETIFHQWHIDDGCDRHVSHHRHDHDFVASSRREPDATAIRNISDTAATKQQSSSSSSTNHRKHVPGSSTNPLLLRNEIVLWNITFTTSTSAGTHTTTSSSTSQPESLLHFQRVTSTIRLELALWDASSGHRLRSSSKRRRGRQQSQNTTRVEAEPERKDPLTVSSKPDTPLRQSYLPKPLSYHTKSKKETKDHNNDGGMSISPTSSSSPTSITSSSSSTTGATGFTKETNSTESSLWREHDPSAVRDHDDNAAKSKPMEADRDHPRKRDDDDDDNEFSLPYSLRRQKRYKPERYHNDDRFQEQSKSEGDNVSSHPYDEVDNDRIDNQREKSQGGDDNMDPFHFDIFSSLSHLYGIGQHITLSPVDPLEPLVCYTNVPHQHGGMSLSETKDDETTSSHRIMPSVLAEYLSHSTIHRHDCDIDNDRDTHQNDNMYQQQLLLSTPSFHILSILSTWLQTALNVAASNSQCYLPMFGTWSRYEPIEYVDPQKQICLQHECHKKIPSNPWSVFPSWMYHFPNSLMSTKCRFRDALSVTEAAKYHMKQEHRHYQQKMLAAMYKTSPVASTKRMLASPLMATPKKIVTGLAAPIVGRSKHVPTSLPQDPTRSKFVEPLASSSSRGNTFLLAPRSKNRQSMSPMMMTWNFDLIPPVMTGRLLSEHYDTRFFLYALSLAHCRMLSEDDSWNNPKVSLGSDNTCFVTPPRWTYWGYLLQHHCLLQQNRKYLISPRFRNHMKKKKNRHRTHEATTMNRPEQSGDALGDVSSSFVNLYRANHTYCWYKCVPPDRGIQRLLWLGTKNSDIEWRPDLTTIPIAATTNKLQRRFLQYRNQCRLMALQRIERATGCTRSEPLWGPPDDPILSLHATLTWMSETNDGIHHPLLSLPLKSRHSQSVEDFQEMEDATEATILDINRPTLFYLSVHFDHNTPHASLAATQRCILAALIRTSTLPKETLLSHIVDEGLMDQWDRAAGNKIANAVARRIGADSTTVALVAAMDWATAAEDMIQEYQAEDIIKGLFNSTMDYNDSLLGFPTPPAGYATNSLPRSTSRPDDYGTEKQNHMQSNDAMLSRLWKPLRKGAPPGRFLSLLCTHMARVRSPCSMSLVWILFCQELRQRWNERQSLPNMRYVPGLDCYHHIDEEATSLDGTTSVTMNQAVGSHGQIPALGNSFVSMMGGIKAHLAASVNCSEPDPEESYCLIGQKLQVYNIGVETALRYHVNDDSFAFSGNANQNVDDKFVQCTNGKEADSLMQTPSMKHNSFDLVHTHVTTQDGSFGRVTDSDEFFDATDHELIEFVQGNVTSAYAQPRRGARCPVHDVSLVETGEQLFAPYLQRQSPLTDDVIAERRLMLTRQGNDEVKNSIRQRLEIIHRILKPKLFSDMQSFKAANPGSTLQDFVMWYGNPADLLAWCDEGLLIPGCDNDVDVSNSKSTSQPIGSLPRSISVTSEKASEAALALGQMRALWSSAWEEALPIPAIEQGPLFDAENIVEMTLDYLENIHPASLLCQIAAVNLSSAYFSLLVSSGETVLRIPTVAATMLQLRDKIEAALYLLSVEATRATTQWHDKKEKTVLSSDHFMMTSIDALTSCSAACGALGQAEVIIARAASLMYKLKNEYELIESVLRSLEGSPVRVTSQSAQDLVLDTIHNRQQQIPEMNGENNSTATSSRKLKPALREYMLRNMDDNLPCQLSVRYSDEGIKVCDYGDRNGYDSTIPFENGILLALSLTNPEF